ncbi:MAG: SDR family NAD(P)-dependent oxidoreductase [Deltaproteobacteria bacterium]|nr:SDR family NAD(P)-dependent oxidoreductase [Deltaproteobacteria bacterium]MBW2393358.1 SDR family NAD(P)-dependent oxidoreductase [Deltaproteobacteria bacterium]
MTKKVCLITGVGPGTGTALVRRFAEGYAVAMIARNAERLSLLEKEVPGARAFPCDVTDEPALTSTLDQIQQQMGSPSVAIHNAVAGAFGDFQTIDPAVLRRNFEINTMALLHLARSVAPSMIEAGEGAILITGNTSTYRGKADFAGFAPSKAAQRILGESMARSLGPQGVHVAYLAIDAVIDLPWTRKMLPDKPDSFFCRPDDIAGECWHLVHQPRSAWTFDVTIRPDCEPW